MTSKTKYDEWGISAKFNNPRAKGVKNEEIEKANEHAKFWFYDCGVNPIPCMSANKNHYLMEYAKYYNQDMTEKLFNHCLETGVFAYGIAILMGKIWRGPYKGAYFNVIDCDNKKGSELMLKLTNSPSIDGKDGLASKTLTESYQASGYKIHIYFITLDQPLVKKSPNIMRDDDLPAIEIYGDKRVVIASNSKKTNTAGLLKECIILGTKNIIKLDESQRTQFQIEIDNALREYGISYLNKDEKKASKTLETYDEILDEDNKVYAGGNRQLRTLKICDRLLLDLYKRHSILSLEDIKRIARKKSDLICDPPLENWEFEQKWKEAVQWTSDIKGSVEGEAELKKELEDLGVVPNNDVTAESMPSYVEELKELLDRMKQEYNSPVDIDIATETVMDKYCIKTIDGTQEMFFFDGKRYTGYGDSLIEKELELMQSEERRKLNRMLEMEQELDRMMIQRNNAGMDILELTRYEYELVKRAHEQRFRQLKVRTAFRREVVSKINVKTRVAREAFTVDPNRIIVNNGILDLHRKKITASIDGDERETENLSWTLRQHSPEVLALNMFPVDYNPNATCPNFVKALLQVCEHDLKLYVNIVKMLGYCIYQSCEFQTAFMLYGLGDNMKSVILRVIEKLLGEENVCNIPLHDLCGDDKFFAAQLFGKTANIFADIPFHRIKNSSKFKAAVAGDRMEGQNKNQPSFYFKPYAKHVYATNRISDSEDNTFGWFKRWVLLHFKVRIPKHLQDRQLINKVTTPEELSGIFNLALKGLKLLFRDGGFNVGSITNIKKEYEKQSSLVREFIMEGYHVDAGNGSDEYYVLTEQVQTDFINFLNDDEGHRLEYIKSELVNSGIKDRGIDLNNKLDRFIAICLLGRELAAMDIENKTKLDAKTGNRPHYYVGLKPRTISLSELEEIKNKN